MLNKFLLFLMCLVCLFAGFSASAQINSPYSRFGIGDQTDPNLTALRSMGGIGAAFRDYKQINYLNPASYSSFYQSVTTTIYDKVIIDTTIFDEALGRRIQSQLVDSVGRDTVLGVIKVTSFQTGVSGEILTIADQNDELQTFNSSLGYMALAFPVPKIGGISFGIMPYSNVNYNTMVEMNVNDTVIGQRNVRLLGNGGIFQFYGGIGASIKNFSAGVNVQYLFGTLDMSSITYFPGQRNSLGTRREIFHEVRGFNFDLGLQYVYEFDEEFHLNLGAYGKPATNVDVKTDTVWDRVIFVQDEIFSHVDSLSYNLNSEGELSLPASFGIGFMLEKENNWMFGAEYGMELWSKSNGFLANRPQNDSWHIRLGGQFIPDYQGNFMQRLNYRFGFYYNQTNLILNNNPVDDLGITFGFGIPVREKNNVPSSVDLAFRIGTMGGVQQNLMSQNYFNFSLGFNLNDKNWIFKSRFN